MAYFWGMSCPKHSFKTLWGNELTLGLSVHNICILHLFFKGDKTCVKKDFPAYSHHHHHHVIRLPVSQCFRICDLRAWSKSGRFGRSIEIHQLMDRFYELQHVSIQLLYPTEIVLGLMYVPVDRLTLLLDFHWSEWSKAKNWEFISDKSGADMNPEFMEDFGYFYGVIPDYDKQSAEMRWKDTWIIKFGVEYALSPVMALRAGYAFDQGAMDGNVIHPVNPDLDQNIISSGFWFFL